MDVLVFQNAFDLAADLEGVGAVKQVEERAFPDGEVLVRLPQDVGLEVVLLTRLYPNVNDNLVKLVLTLDALSDLGVQKIILLIPYLPYARQDRRFRPGEPISSKTVLRILGSYPVSALVALDVHKPHIADYTPRISLANVYPASEFAERLSEVDVVLSPDFGSIQRAEAVAKSLGVPHTYFEKYRDRETGAIALLPRHDVDLRGKKSGRSRRYLINGRHVGRRLQSRQDSRRLRGLRRSDPLPVAERRQGESEKLHRQADMYRHNPQRVRGGQGRSHPAEGA
jgi:ribose-phosphate pyrophosphokinase